MPTPLPVDPEQLHHRRMIEMYGADDHTPMPPAAFWDHLSPAWARVWLEVADELKDSRLPWKDLRVLEQWLRITGFNPKQFEFAPELSQQQRALRLAREVVDALYVADEIEQLDGVPALDYAHGWMVALHFVASLSSCNPGEEGACNNRLCPPAEMVDRVVVTSVDLYHPASREEFANGFRSCVSKKLNQVGCVLRCKP